MSSLTKICLLIAILLLAMEVRGGKIPMMEEAMDESMDENEAGMVDNPAEAEMDHVTGDAGDAKDKDEDCKCGDNVNKALINSLAACSQTLSTIEECKVGKVSSITSNEQVVPCTCEETLTTHLVKSVKSCTDAVETLTKCEKEKAYHSCDELYRSNPNLKSGTYTSLQSMAKYSLCTVTCWKSVVLRVDGRESIISLRTMMTNV